MLHVILLQFATTVMVACMAAMFCGAVGFISAMFGGLCCVVPNSLFAFRLFANAHTISGANPMSFFIGEFVKITLTVALMGAVAWWYHDLNWLAMIAAFIVVLKSYIILLIRH